MYDAPMIEVSSEAERRVFIKRKYPCLADCDICGLRKWVKRNTNSCVMRDNRKRRDD